MDWYRKLHPSERAEQALEQILTRTGIGEEITKEIENDRATRFEILRKRKAAVVAKFLDEKDLAQKNADVVANAELAARRAAENALQDHIRAQNVIRDFLVSFREVTDHIDSEMLTCCDPCIDEFLAELSQLLEECEALIKVRVDEKGKVAFDNRQQVDSRARAILELQTVIVPNLKTSAHVSNAQEEITRLRNSIPKVTS